MKKTLTLLLLTLFTCCLFAQNFQGKAIYRSKRKLDIKMDSTQVNSEMHSQMMEMLKKQFEKTYTLNFNPNESIYKEEVKLGAPQKSSGIEIMIVNSGGSDVLYKNIKENRFTNQNDIFGKIFLTASFLCRKNMFLVTYQFFQSIPRKLPSFYPKHPQQTTKFFASKHSQQTIKFYPKLH